MMKNKNSLKVLLLGMSLAVCQVLQADVQSGCETVANTQGFCGFAAPEDIDVMPGGKQLLLSPIVGMDGTELQHLSLFTIATQQVMPVRYQQDKASTEWGDAQCVTPPAAEFSPHGVHISQRESGQWQLLAVNHLRESVEFYEIYPGSEPSLAWRGCVIMPSQANINDLVGLADGGFLVSHMVDRDTMPIMEAMSSTKNTGYVWHWDSVKGLAKVAGSEGIVPNGLALSADGQALFISETGAQRIRKIDLVSGKELGVVKLGPVDNLSWAADGRLIATRITGAMPEDCFTKPGPCLTPFQVVAIDPQTMALSVLHNQQGKPMGMASVAVVQGDYIYIGSFKGHQLLRVSLKP